MADLRANDEGLIRCDDNGERHPFSVVWTTLPLISWIVPVVGHMGVADSQGIVYDFSGPYQVTVSSLMCGPAKRTWRLDANEIQGGRDSASDLGHQDGAMHYVARYDKAVIDASRIYAKRMHNLVCDNCHSHVAMVLNLLQYEGHSNWNQVLVLWRLWTRGKWTSKREAIIVYAPLLLLVVIIAGLVAGFA